MISFAQKAEHKTFSSETIRSGLFVSRFSKKNESMRRVDQ